jgi:endonuclease YncB( thermonuclease family)
LVFSAMTRPFVRWCLLAAIPCGVLGPGPSRAGALSEFQTQVIPGPIPAEVRSVHDGDTLEVLAAVWPDQIIRVSVRVDGVDTPEIRGHCEAETRRAIQARDRVRALVAGAGQQVRLGNVRRGKYAGRVVAQVTMADGRDLGRVLLSEGLARPYGGGRRTPWCAG